MHHSTIDHLPPPARRVLRVLRRRYWSQPPHHRPARDDSTSYVGLIHRSELVTLAMQGCWPLPPAALRLMAEPPAVRHRQRRAFERAVERTVATLLARHGPAVRALLFNGRGR